MANVIFVKEWTPNRRALFVDYRLRGMHPEWAVFWAMVEHYLYCGDHSVMSILEWLETGRRTADYYNNEHLRWLQSAGKIEP